MPGIPAGGLPIDATAVAPTGAAGQAQSPAIAHALPQALGVSASTAPASQSAQAAASGTAASGTTGAGTAVSGTAVSGTAVSGTAAAGTAAAGTDAAEAVRAASSAASLPASLSAAGSAASAEPAKSSPATPVAPAQDAAATALAQAGAPAAPPATVTVAPTAPTASAAPAAAAHQPFADQVSKPVFALATAGDGNHTMTISVTPDNLGPVTVRAHISGENVRIELFSPSDSGREALRQLLPDLRRDLSATGANTDLDLSSQGQPDAQPNPGTLREDPRAGETGGRRRDADTPSGPVQASRAHLPVAGSPGLDVIA